MLTLYFLKGSIFYHCPVIFFFIFKRDVYKISDAFCFYFWKDDLIIAEWSAKSQEEKIIMLCSEDKNY